MGRKKKKPIKPWCWYPKHVLSIFKRNEVGKAS